MSIYKLVEWSELEAQVDITKPLFADTETDGLYGRVELLQCMQEGWDYVLMVRRPQPICIISLFSKLTSVWHNAHYDITTVQQQTNSRWQPENFEDTFLLSRLVYPQYESYTLDSVLTYVLGFDPYEQAGLDKKALQKSKWSNPVLTSDQLLYAALDVFHMPELYEAVVGALDDQNYILDKSTLKTCWDFQWNGMPVDNDRLYAKWSEIEAELATIPMPVNANSPKQVTEWLGIDSSADLVLAELALIQGDERAGNVRRVRSLRKMLSFLAKFDVDEDIIYGKFKPSARSGRLTSDDQNLQQLPRALKEVFGVGEDEVLIYSDYAQLELRTICAILGVSILEKLFRDNVDVHSYVASILFGEDFTKDDRQVTKTYNFNLLYGGSVKMVLTILLKYGFVLEEWKANRHKAKWLNLFGEIQKWQEEQISAWRKGKLSCTPLGRLYKGKLMTDQMNIKNQGAGAEVAKLALHYFEPWRREHATDYVICNFIHDSFIIRGPNDPARYELVAQKLAECMQEAWFQMSKLYKIKDLPMPVNVKVGRNWGDIEKDKGLLFELDLEPYAMLEQENG